MSHVRSRLRSIYLTTISKIHPRIFLLQKLKTGATVICLSVVPKGRDDIQCLTTVVTCVIVLRTYWCQILVNYKSLSHKDGVIYQMQSDCSRMIRVWNKFLFRYPRSVWCFSTMWSRSKNFEPYVFSLETWVHFRTLRVKSGTLNILLSQAHLKHSKLLCLMGGGNDNSLSQSRDRGQMSDRQLFDTSCTFLSA